MQTYALLILLFQTAFITHTCLGQHTTKQTSLYLTSYTIPQNGSDVGNAILRYGKDVQLKTVIIAGEHADAFKIDRNHQLSVRKDRLRSNANWWDVILRATTSEGEIQDTFRVVREGFILNKVIAHRGAWKNTGATENSIAALTHAIKMGCEGSEFDVHMSADSVPVVNHDPHIQGISIASTSFQKLSGIKLPNGENLPTLKSYLQAGIGQNKTKLILEIKPSQLGKERSLILTHQVVTLVEKLRAQAWVDYISFDYEVCKEIMKLAPYAKVAYLMGDKTPAQLSADHFFGLDYHFSVLEKNPSWIKEAQQNKLTVNLWTVNDKTLMEDLLRQNVHFITTNEPELLLNIIQRK